MISNDTEIEESGDSEDQDPVTALSILLVGELAFHYPLINASSNNSVKKIIKPEVCKSNLYVNSSEKSLLCRAMLIEALNCKKYI
ncbi:hypothetical protein FQA39_LY01016 [Lamprigera yunnana]|nr:hypothetical protein FQA39_LY01016 [Lamprigera yunnana]